MRYQPIIGMEIHVELKTKSKMFCGCVNNPFYAPKPNIYTCPTCLGLPGALPFANKKAIEWTVLLGLALGCQINFFSKFDRKHYFYPDLPKGYQISQYDLPFCYNGLIETKEGKVRIRRIHLEEDTAKLIHQKINGEDVTLIDFNRSGVPLIEIVSEPDIHSSTQAKEFAKKLHQIIRYLDIADCDMEKGGMRLEANVSLQYEEGKLPSYKVEVKNINSFRFLEKAVEYEIKRQEAILKTGKTPHQETRGYSSEKNITYSQRKKEEAADYRYFPDPDLPPIRISNEWLEEIKKNLPEDYDQRVNRLAEKYQTKKEWLELLFETDDELKILEEVFSSLKKKGVSLAKLINLLINKKIKVNLFKDSLEKIVLEFKKITSVLSLNQTDLEKIVFEVIKENEKAVYDFKKGKKEAINFLVGMVFKKAKAKLDFHQVASLIKKKIE